MMGILCALPVQAQPVSCQIEANTITPFRAPEYNASLVWKAMLGEKGLDQFSDLVTLDDGSLVLGGAYAAKGESKFHPYLVRMEPRGKVLWEVRGTSKTSQTIDHVIRDAKSSEIVTLGSLIGDDGQTKKSIVTRYDDKGKKLGAFVVEEEGGHLDPSMLIAQGDHYYLAARYLSLRDKNQRFGVVYKLDKQGGRMWRRAYIPGLNSTIAQIAPLKNGDLVMAGEVIDKTDRTVGWVVRIDSKGAIAWQRVYPRGRSVSYTHVAVAPDGTGYYVGGTSYPAGKKRSVATIAKIDTTGNVIWERYYASAYDYRLNDLDVAADGRLAIVVGATPAVAPDEENMPHARLLVLSPRGQLLDTQSYTDGGGLGVNHLFLQGTTPLLAGVMKVPAPETKDKPKEPVPENTDAWVAGAITLPSYTDPCLPQ